MGYTGGLTTSQAAGAWLTAHTPRQEDSRGPVRRQQAQQTEHSLADFQAILDVNPFGAKRSEVARSEPKPETPAQTTPTPAPAPGPATLELTLTGVMITPGQRFATVRGPSGRQEEVYRIGECVPAGETHPSRDCEPNQGRLARVNPRNIKVAYRDQLLSYDLAQETTGGPPRPARAPARPARQVTKPEPTPQVGGNEFPSERQGDTIEVRVPSDEVNKAFENFSDILRQARVVPFNSGDLQGFQIRRIQSGSIFQRIGLENMDVIKSVNGESITTADKALRLLTMFRNEKEIKLDIQRANQDLTIDYYIE